MSKMKMKQKAIILCAITFVLSACLMACSQQAQPSESDATGDAGGQVSEDKGTNGVAVSFSKEAGFYGTAFDLTLSCEEGNEIYYTMDGTDPRTSNTAKLYSEKIKIWDNTNSPNVYSAIKNITLWEYNPPSYKVDKGMMVRAVAKNAEGEFGDVTTNSYFVNKTANYYSDFRVISMVTDSEYLFNPITGVYMVGTKYYEWARSSDFVELHQDDVLNPTNYNQEGRETEFPVSIQVFEKGNAVYSADVGARISGNWTRGGAQKSFRFYARKEYGTSKMEYAFFDNLLDNNGELIDKFDKVTLRNGGNDHILHFRDAFIQELAQGLEVDYMAAEPYILFLNGEFWGFYLLREKPEDYYIQSHYGIDDKEVAVIKNSELDSGTEEDLEEYREFTVWAATADMTKDKNYQKFCQQMDVQSFMDYVTVETYINNNDWAVGYLNNWIAWKSKTVNPDIPKADGKWRFIFYDLDYSSGLYGMEQTAYNYDSINKMYSEELEFSLMDILKNLCKNETFKKQFYDNYLRIMETCFAPERVSDTLDEYLDRYGDAMWDTHFRFDKEWAAHSYEGEAEGLREFFNKRPQYAKKQLQAYCRY